MYLCIRNYNLIDYFIALPYCYRNIGGNYRKIHDPFAVFVRDARLVNYFTVAVADVKIRQIITNLEIFHKTLNALYSKKLQPVVLLST
jgi:hypothetical protein